MIITYDLEPKYTNQKSFYGKAVVRKYPSNVIRLHSYNTHVASYFPETDTFEVYNLQSNTTVKHIREFIQQQGHPYMTKREIEENYYKGEL